MIQRLRNFFIGTPRNINDTAIFQKISLIAFLAWVGIGADGLSSSCYGPEEAFRVLTGHPYLSIFVGIATAITVFIIVACYSQIVRLFPSGGGGYVVASKLLSPQVGAVSGSALLIDYVLTIAISIASGTDALFSFLPPELQPVKLGFALFFLFVLIILNMRGVKESVLALMPIFLLFVATHFFLLLYIFSSHIVDISTLTVETVNDVRMSVADLGMFGMFALFFKAYSMGAGTYTGIEAVSNSMPILRAPRVETAIRTMRYMAISLSLIVFGIMAAYSFYRVQPSLTKTLNAVLFSHVTAPWGKLGSFILVITLLSEALLLFVAAQTGFIGGPRVLANMSLDKWFPTKFALLSDRLVTQKGIFLMGVAAATAILFSNGSVHMLVVLYSINVFITFFLSQLGMVRHWWQERHSDMIWKKNLITSGIGLFITGFILVSIVIVKFTSGAWFTLLITGTVVALAFAIKRHYKYTDLLFSRLDDLVLDAIASMRSKENSGDDREMVSCSPYNPQGKTAVILVNGFTGLGLHTVYHVLRIFGDTFRNFVFVQVGVIDAGKFKGVEELDALKEQVQDDQEDYVSLMKWHGYYAEAFFSIGTDVVEEVGKLIPKIKERFSNITFFGGQMIFPRETFFTRLLHNHTVFSMQSFLYPIGIPMVILPISTQFMPEPDSAD
ncbi:MAG: APC family permease [Candidatus Ratteibacteria bacterium]|jgi:amino acid transporter